MAELSDELREFLAGTLPKSAHKRIEAIVAYVAEVYDPVHVHEVEVHNARVPVEAVHAYGLDIKVDANGNAVTVGFPYGAQVMESGSTR